jgi:pyridoxal phosphate enzyme (YggS family)
VTLNKESFALKLNSIKSKLPLGSKLLLVSKTRSEEEIRAYYELGQRDFGENRVQELMEKSEHLKAACPEIRWHMIGNLQSNKINQLFLVSNLWAIHSVDDRDLLEKLIKTEGRLDSPLRLFLQFNTSKEVEKSGFEDYASLKAAASLISATSKIKLQGLMTMGTLRTEDFQSEAKRCFHELNELKDKLSQELGMPLETSMGMSQDYQIALDEKSHWIRLGTMMFEGSI